MESLNIFHVHSTEWFGRHLSQMLVNPLLTEACTVHHLLTHLYLDRDSRTFCFCWTWIFRKQTRRTRARVVVEIEVSVDLVSSSNGSLRSHSSTESVRMVLIPKSSCADQSYPSRAPSFRDMSCCTLTARSSS